MSYVRLKHTLSEIAIDAVARGRTAPVAWLDGYARLATVDAPAVPLEALGQEVADGDEGLRLLLRRGVLARAGDAVAIAGAFLPHLAYLQQVAPRLVDAVARLPGELDRGLSETVAPGVALFNAGLYFECHEYYEGVWREAPPEDRELFHGLIQVAAAFYHYEKGNAHGAQQLLDRGTQRLRTCPSVQLNVNVAALLSTAERWQDVFARLPRGAGREQWRPLPLSRQYAPQIIASPQEK